MAPLPAWGRVPISTLPGLGVEISKREMGERRNFPFSQCKKTEQSPRASPGGRWGGCR